jgi:ketosteroid isomerase-like protein
VSKESTRIDLDLARQSNEAFTRRDFDGGLAMFRPDAVWDASPIGAGVVEGREAIRRDFEVWVGAYEEWEQTIEELRDLGNGVGLAVYLQRGRPVGSSEFVELRYAVVGTWRGGLVERVIVYADIDQARAAAERLAQERG